MMLATTWAPWTSNSALIISSSHQFPSKNPNKPHLSLLCRSVKPENNLHFVLHDALQSSDIDTKHARASREEFCSQIERLWEIERETSISINRNVDLGKVALHIAGEDDSLVSHSSVQLPVDAFVDRLDDLSMGFCSHYIPPVGSSPELFLGNLERYFYVHKGFQRATVMNQTDARALYLHSVLTHRSGSVAMLSLIYSEMLKMLRLCGFLNFDVEIYHPHDLVSRPRGYHKQKSKFSDEAHIMTPVSLLLEILRDLKDAFWPFLYDHGTSLFLRAADAANCVSGPRIVEESWFELASAKAAQHRLGRGVWTSVRFGDMRLALAACERLILLESGPQEFRDYSILLYHCGFYEESLQYLKLYRESQECDGENKFSSSPLWDLEEDAVEKLMTRLILISMEEGWSRPSSGKNFLENQSEPW